MSDVVLHSHNSSHPSSVVSKENTTKGSKRAHQIGLDGDGRLDTRSVSGPVDNSSSCHFWLKKRVIEDVERLASCIPDTSCGDVSAEVG